MSGLLRYSRLEMVGKALPGAGTGSLRIARSGRRSVVEHAVAQSPLKLLEPKNHGSAAWVFVATYGGGLVGGDRIALDARVKAGAGLLLATQASTKIYPSLPAAQQLAVEVEEDALLVSVPDPVVCFAGASYRQEIAIGLAPSASLVLLDGLNAGRTASGERWAFERYASHIRITRAGVSLLEDSLLLDSEPGPLAHRMGRFEAMATLIALGPRCTELAADLLAGGTPLARSADLVIAPSPRAEGAVVRFAGVSVELVSRAVYRLLERLPSLLGDDPFRGRR